MWFLIKGTFWFSLVLVLLPFFDTSEPASPDTSPKVDVGNTVSAASEALGYIGALCIEKPDVCVKGTETFTALGHRARDGARIAYEFLDTQFGAGGDPVMTGTVGAPATDANTKADIADLPSEAPKVPHETGHAPEEADAFPVSRVPVPERRIEPQPPRG